MGGGKLEGTKVKIGRTEYVVPDPTIETAESVAQKLEDLAKGGPGALSRVAEVIAIAVRENYPDVDGPTIARTLKVRDSSRVLREVLAALGMEPGSGEAPPP